MQWTDFPASAFPNTHVPVNFNTYTVAVGTKFLLRKNKYVVPFARPGLDWCTSRPSRASLLPSSPCQLVSSCGNQQGRIPRVLRCRRRPGDYECSAARIHHHALRLSADAPFCRRPQQLPHFDWAELALRQQDGEIIQFRLQNKRAPGSCASGACLAACSVSRPKAW